MSVLIQWQKLLLDDRQLCQLDRGEDNDEWAIANNYVSVVPCQFDLTAHQVIPVLNEDWEILD